MKFSKVEDAVRWFIENCEGVVVASNTESCSRWCKTDGVRALYNPESMMCDDHVIAAIDIQHCVMQKLSFRARNLLWRVVQYGAAHCVAKYGRQHALSGCVRERYYIIEALMILSNFLLCQAGYMQLDGPPWEAVVAAARKYPFLLDKEVSKNLIS